MIREEVETLGQESSKAFGNQDIDDIAAFYTDDARILPRGRPSARARRLSPRSFSSFSPWVPKRSS